MLTLRDWRSHVWWPFLVMTAAFAALEIGGFDRAIANALYYDPARGWLGAGRGAWWAHKLIHTDGKNLVRALAAAALLAWALSFAWKPLAAWRREALFVFLGMIAVTALVGLLKVVTNVDCPWDLVGFGGDRPYVALFADRPNYLPQARCFPGAHSSSGFAVLAVYFALRDRARRASHVALGFGIALGVTFAIGQEARGAHFLSHDLASAAIAWGVLVALYSKMMRASVYAAMPDARQPTMLRDQVSQSPAANTPINRGFTSEKS
jgi:membrane-associated PAP2 superfamily phosphatase